MIMIRIFCDRILFFGKKFYLTSRKERKAREFNIRGRVEAISFSYITHTFLRIKVQFLGFWSIGCCSNQCSIMWKRFSLEDAEMVHSASF